jgi:hypothetical protein
MFVITAIKDNTYPYNKIDSILEIFVNLFHGCSKGERNRHDGTASFALERDGFTVFVSSQLAFNESYARAFGSHAPARSTIVSQLVLPQALVEIEVVARRPRP